MARLLSEKTEGMPTLFIGGVNHGKLIRADRHAQTYKAAANRIFTPTLDGKESLSFDVDVYHRGRFCDSRGGEMPVFRIEGMSDEEATEKTLEVLLGVTKQQLNDLMFGTTSAT